MHETAVIGRGAPLVSVIIPVYNGARFLPEAIANILGQSYPSLEIIVVDDGSTDDLDAVVAALPIALRYLKQGNAGPAAARNRGIEEASAELIAFLDVDDLWPENVLGPLVQTLAQNPQYDAVRGFAQLMAANKDTGRFEPIGDPRDCYPYYIGAGLYRRSAFQNVGLFDPELRFAEDADWFARAREKKLKIVQLDRVTLLVRRHDRNMTRGRSPAELNPVRVFKKALDRRRARSVSATPD
jgi:glycosyltransferase involved in cell wall biosynthesis